MLSGSRNLHTCSSAPQSNSHANFHLSDRHFTSTGILFYFILISPPSYLLPYLLTYLLTPWCIVLLEKLTGLQLVKKFPAFLWNPKVHYRTHKRPPPVPVLGQPNPVPIPTSHLLEIHPNIIHPSTPRSPQWSLSLQFPHQDPIRPPLLTHTCHMPSPSPLTQTSVYNSAQYNFVKNKVVQESTTINVYAHNLYRGADKSLARSGRKQPRKHVRDARDFNNIETRAVIKFFPPLQGKAPKEIHAILT